MQKETSFAEFYGVPAIDSKKKIQILWQCYFFNIFNNKKIL